MQKNVVCSLFKFDKHSYFKYYYNFNVNVILDYGKVQPRTLIRT